MKNILNKFYYYIIKLIKKEKKVEKITSRELFEKYKKEKITHFGETPKIGNDGRPLYITYFYDWLKSQSGVINALTNYINDKEKRSVFDSVRPSIEKVIDDEISNELLRKYLEEEGAHKYNNSTILTSTEDKYGYFLDWFLLNKELILEIMIETKSIPQNLLYEKPPNKPNIEIKRILAVESHKDNVKLRKIEEKLNK